MSGDTGATFGETWHTEWRLRPRPFFVWKESFRLGIPTVDRDHQQFFEIINKLQYCVVLGKEQAVVRKSLGELIDYARDHFARQEQALDDVGYPHLPQHQGEHHHFLRELERIDGQPKTSALRAVSI